MAKFEMLNRMTIIREDVFSFAWYSAKIGSENIQCCGKCEDRTYNYIVFEQYIMHSTLWQLIVHVVISRTLIPNHRHTLISWENDGYMTASLEKWCHSESIVFASDNFFFESGIQGIEMAILSIALRPSYNEVIEQPSSNSNSYLTRMYWNRLD